jgi:hypothetical protein
MDDVPEIGPVDYLIVEFPGNHPTGEGLSEIVDLVDRDIIRVLDLVFIKKDLDGVTTVLNLDELELDLSVFDGAPSGLTAQDDVAQAAAVLEPGTSAALLIYENAWAAPFVAAMRRGEAQVVASGRIPVADVLEAIASAEPDLAASDAGVR